MTHSPLKASPVGDAPERWAQLDHLRGDYHARSPAASFASRLSTAKLLIAIRRGRGKFWSEALFGEPAWDILLDLYVAHCEARLVTVSSAAIAGCVPQTTGLRWVTMLTNEGMICRQPSSDDARMVFVSLSESARETVEAYLDWVIATSAGEAGPNSASISPSG
jgi:DNA-binding MarR family transcriptional regulator